MKIEAETSININNNWRSMMPFTLGSKTKTLISCSILSLGLSQASWGLGLQNDTGDDIDCVVDQAKSPHHQVSSVRLKDSQRWGRTFTEEDTKKYKLLCAYVYHTKAIKWVALDLTQQNVDEKYFSVREDKDNLGAVKFVEIPPEKK